mgnify:CR=1 FL=1
MAYISRWPWIDFWKSSFGGAMFITSGKSYNGPHKKSAGLSPIMFIYFKISTTYRSRNEDIHNAFKIAIQHCLVPGVPDIYITWSIPALRRTRRGGWDDTAWNRRPRKRILPFIPFALNSHGTIFHIKQNITSAWVRDRTQHVTIVLVTCHRTNTAQKR